MKILYYILSGLIFTIFASSCDKNLSNSNSNIDIINNSPCFSCAYIPWCDSSRYTYIDTTSGAYGFKNVNLIILSDTIINNTTYSKASLSGKIIYHNCSNNITSFIEYNQSGGSINEIKSTVLKSNEISNAQWQDVFLANGLTNTNNYKITAKSINRNVLGVNYTDVIQVHKTVTVSSSGIGTSIVTEEDNYYAKGIGLIESIVIDAATGDLILHRVLQSYRLN